MTQVLSYEDKQYNRKKSIFDMLAQTFEDIKHSMNGQHNWNKRVADLDGVTFRLIGAGQLEITYHRYEVSTMEMLARGDDTGAEFIKEIEKEVKKKFKELTKKALTLKKVKDDQAIEKTSLLQADTSRQMGYGFGGRMYGRFLVKSSRVYDFDANL